MVLNPSIPKNNLITPALALEFFGSSRMSVYSKYIRTVNTFKYRELIPCLPKLIIINLCMIDNFFSSLNDLINNKLHVFIRSFDGCYNYRYINKSQNLSLHSYGLAVDFNAHLCPPSVINTVNKEISQVFINNGFMWGGNFSDKFKDEMHFELGYSSLYNYYNDNILFKDIPVNL